jgi:hypothetical protein
MAFKVRFPLSGFTSSRLPLGFFFHSSFLRFILFTAQSPYFYGFPASRLFI